jgi:hypothetical protein
VSKNMPVHHIDEHKNEPPTLETEASRDSTRFELHSLRRHGMSAAKRRTISTIADSGAA